MEGEAKCLPIIPHFIIFPYDPTFYNFFPMIPLFIRASISRAEELWLDQNSSQLRLRELLLHDDGNGELVFFCTIPPDKAAATKLYRGKA